MKITVDEQLFPTKACGRFIQYMSKTLDKFGIKFKFYPKCHQYLDKGESRPSIQRLSSDKVAMNFIVPFVGKATMLQQTQSIRATLDNIKEVCLTTLPYLLIVIYFLLKLLLVSFSYVSNKV